MITEKQTGASRPELYEMLEAIDKVDTRVEAVKLIKGYGQAYQAFNDYLRCIFDESIQLLLPKGRPPYTPSGGASVPSTWHKRHLDLAYFVKGLGRDDMNQIKRESMFIQLLESIHPDDALHISLIASKECKVSGLSADVIEEALPGLLKSFEK